MSSKLFYQALFEPGEQVCFAATPYHTGLAPVEDGPEIEAPYFAINPLRKDRRDSNVTCFRNILCEFDTGTLEEQRMLLRDVPYTTLVFSGNKSYHAILSLEVPCDSAESYRKLVKRIYRALPSVDTSGRNPSRLSRAACVIRPDNSKLQELIDLRARVTQLQLDAWLGPEAPEPVSAYLMVPTSKRLITGFTRNFLSFGAEPGQWNRSLFNAACDMFRCGYGYDEAVSALQRITGWLDPADYKTIKSAEKIIRGSIAN